MPKVIIWREGAIETEFDPGHRDWRIGRSETNDITLLDPRKSVSRFHAELREENGRWVFIDLNSQNGSWNTEGQRVNRLVLEHGHEVLFGDYKLSFDDPPPAVAPPPPVPPPVAAGVDTSAAVQTAPVVVPPDQTLLMPGVKGQTPAAVPAGPPPPVVRAATKPKAPRKGVNPVILILFVLAMLSAVGVVAWKLLTDLDTPAQVADAEPPASEPPPAEPPPVTTEPPPTSTTTNPSTATTDPSGPVGPATTTSAATTPGTTPGTTPATTGPAGPGPTTTPATTPGTTATTSSTTPVTSTSSTSTTVPRPPAANTTTTRPGTTSTTPSTTTPGTQKGRSKRGPTTTTSAATVAARYEEGRKAFENGRYVEAERALEAVVAQNPNFRDAGALLQRAKNAQAAQRERALADAQAAESNGDWARAIALYERAGAADQADGARAKMHAAGEDAYRKARQFDARNRPTEAISLYQQAVSWLRDGDPRKATAQERLAALKGGGE